VSRASRMSAGVAGLRRLPAARRLGIIGVVTLMFAGVLAPLASAESTPHLTALTVTVSSHAGSTTAKPGHTELLVGWTGVASLALTLKYRGHTKIETTKQMDSGQLSGEQIPAYVSFDAPWSCSVPGHIYVYYTVKATDPYGASLTREGKFRGGASAARCRALRVADERRRSADARERHEQEEQRRRGDERESREAEEVKQAQRYYCEHVLKGNVGMVFAGQFPHETETECSTDHGAGPAVILRGDPPVAVSG
jgi:hypothetical protein